MKSSGEIDFDSLSKLVDFHLQHHTAAIIAVGTTGEAATLNMQEHHMVIEHVVKYVSGRIPVIAGTGATATATAIALTKSAMEAGADACLLMAPGYVKPTQEGLYRHYKAIAEAVAIPQILYNVPGRTVSDILPATVARLAELPNIVGIKEATGNIERTKEILSLCGDKMDVYSGDDATAKACMLAGGKGVISVTANVAPQLMHELCTAATASDVAKADAIDAKLQPLHQKLFVESNPIPVKWALAQMGYIPNGIRLPLTWLSEKFHVEVAAALEHAGISLASAKE
jgi:4-hydroxy-tetrahydrodipicolinate synthase